MSSRSGAWAVGSDGSDFLHRERVASHYKTSATNKSRLKSIIVLHFLMAALMFARLSRYLLKYFGMTPPFFLRKLVIPQPEMWEMIWCLSTLASIFGWMGLPKNKSIMLQQYAIGTILFGLCPVLYAAYDLSDDFINYINTKNVMLFFLGYPAVLLWYGFIAIMIQIHAFGLYFAVKLMQAWNSMAKKKKS
ncbi:unnamed protein product [Owenia fusiformis]|uniref:Protein jagunal n=1 Tax=Owenia fusiformis TaxID=6347 RepID=A0A8S4PY95_OWEFU|nr:unnamed protein product [Owenia fusiformis]